MSAFATETHADQNTTFRELAVECSEAMTVSEDRFATRLITVGMADELEAIARSFSASGKLSELLPELNESAAECVAFSRQISGDFLFSPSQNRYMSASQLAATIRAEREAQVSADREANFIAEQRRMEEERLAEQREQDALNFELNFRVYFACSELSRVNPTEAYTNEVCIDSFRVNGLPE